MKAPEFSSFDKVSPVPVKAPTPIKTACVYCGSSHGADPVFAAETKALGEAMARSGIRLVYGGGRVGLMGVVADAVMDAGGEVVGVIPEHIHERELQHTGLTELIVVDSMHTRKRIMADRSEAFVIVPGGYGTLDEMFEILTWKQLDLHNSPVILFNIKNYWDPLITLIDHQAKSGFVSERNRRLFSIANSVEEVLAHLVLAETEPAAPPADIR